MDIKKLREIKRISKGDTSNTDMLDIELDYQHITNNFMNKYRISNRDDSPRQRRNHVPSSIEIKGQIIESSRISTNDNALFEENYTYIVDNAKKNLTNDPSTSVRKNSTKYSFPKKKVIYNSY